MTSVKRFVVSYVLIFLSVTFFVSCDKCVEGEKVMAENLSYLSVQSDKKLSEFTSEEWNVLKEAQNRLTISTDRDGLSVIKELSGSEVNISENLFCIIQRMVENGNKIIAKGSCNMTRMAGDNCVAKCIVWVARCFGANLNLSTVSDEIRSRDCEGGVPSGRVAEILGLWFVIEPVSIPITTAALGGGQIIAVILESHAVVFQSLNGDEIYFYDEDLVREDTDDPTNGYGTVPAMYVTQAHKAIGMASGM